MEQEQNRHENAVSPVIGVMLMIVVTIIIAAVVSAFAGGLAGDQKKTPSAQIDVQIAPEKDASGSWYSQIRFIHKGGDPIKTRDLQIITWNRYALACYIGDSVCNDRVAANPAGFKHVTDGSLSGVSFNRDAFTNSTGSIVTNDGFPCKLVDGTCNSAGNRFGNSTWMNGDVIATNNAAASASVLGSGGVLIPGQTIGVDIVYIPTDTLLVHKDVISS
jgi:FlaG/FlaF family flagellin (archaellin)